MTDGIMKISSSFRDPGGQVFSAGDGIYRHIRLSAMPHYRKLMESGLYDALVSRGLLVPHEDATEDPLVSGIASPEEAVIRPRKVSFISYPSERGFAALKAGALVTLEVQRLSLEHGMTLQDATAFNVQFMDGRWVFIDTGSFHALEKPEPWRAYGQFCRHFLAPLTLMAGRDGRMVSLLAKYTDGIPLDLAARLLPWKMKMKPAVWMHIVLHGRLAAKDAGRDELGSSMKRVNMNALHGLVEHLHGFISGLGMGMESSAWTSYEDTHSYKSDEYAAKEEFVLNAVKRVTPQQVWDFGANTGHFSRTVASRCDAGVTAFEYDFMTFEAGYMKNVAGGGGNVPLHLWMDLFNPTSGLGWGGEEWPGLAERGPADLVLVLALVHHLCLAGGIPFERVFGFLHRVARHLVVEFVPRSDPQAQRLIRMREEMFTWYERDTFEKALSHGFEVLETREVSSTRRVLYLLRRKDAAG